jgi:hypothetical protein
MDTKTETATETKTKDPIAELLSKFATLNDSVQDTQKSIKNLNEKAILWDKPETKPESAGLSDSTIGTTIDRVTDWKFMDVPIGAAVVGGAAGVFLTELTDGLLVKLNFNNAYAAGAIKLFEAGVIVKWGKKWIGKDTANIVALLLTFDAVVNDFLPSFFTAIGTGANKLTGTTTTAGLSPKYSKASLGYKIGTTIIPNKIPANPNGNYQANVFQGLSG